MNAKLFQSISICLFGLSLFAGCKKDPIDPPPPPRDNVTSYFSVIGGTNVNAELPVAAGTSINKPVIDSILGNNSVLAGSGNNLSVYFHDAQNDAQKFIIGVKGAKGYYNVPTGAAGFANVVVVINETITKEDFVVVVGIQDAGGNIGSYFEVAVHLVTSISNGALEVTLSWDRENDLDIHLLEPGGEEIYYGNSESANGGSLDKDSNAGCSLDSLKIEHITYPAGSSLEAGVYTVRVDFWSDCSVTSNTNFIVSAKLNGDFVPVVTGSNPHQGTFVAGTSDGGGLGSGTEVMTFNVNGNSNSKVVVWRFKPLNYVNTK